MPAFRSSLNAHLTPSAIRHDSPIPIVTADCIQLSARNSPASGGGADRDHPPPLPGLTLARGGALPQQFIRNVMIAPFREQKDKGGVRIIGQLQSLRRVVESLCNALRVDHSKPIGSG